MSRGGRGGTTSGSSQPGRYRTGDLAKRPLRRGAALRKKLQSKNETKDNGNKIPLSPELEANHHQSFGSNATGRRERSERPIARWGFGCQTDRSKSEYEKEPLSAFRMSFSSSQFSWNHRRSCTRRGGEPPGSPLQVVAGRLEFVDSTRLD